MKKIYFIVLLLITTSVHGVPLVDSQYKVGEARFKYMFWKIYDSELYTDNKQFESLDQEVTLSIEYQRNIPKYRIVDATVGQWEELNYAPEKIEKWKETINAIIPEIAKNDNLSFHKNNNGIGMFYYNERLIGKIESKEFSEAFLSIWLSEQTTQPKLRERLINP